MKLVSLASGSLGNVYCVESQGRVLLIDCGLCWRDFASRLATAGIAQDQIAGVLVTHNHIDHVKGIGTFHRRLPDVPLFANLMTAEATAAGVKIDEEAFTPFENGQPFEIGPFEVTAFSIPHDVPDPVGYMVRAGELVYFHATDVGSPLDSIGVHLAEADFATLESNHDPVLLRNSDRAESLKRRIRGPRGHLANDESAELVRRFASPRLKELRLAHLSRECNEPHLAEAEMKRALGEIGRADVVLRVLSQDAVC